MKTADSDRQRALDLPPIGERRLVLDSGVFDVSEIWDMGAPTWMIWKNLVGYALAQDLSQGLVFNGGAQVGAEPVDNELARHVLFFAT